MNTTSAGTSTPTAESWAFAEDYTAASDGLRQARDEATVAGLRPISQGVASLLTVLAATTRAKAVVEIGTGMGASALALFQGMAPDGILTSIDSEAENQLPARGFLASAGYPSSRFRLITGTPLDVLPKLRDGAYDMIFINGDKLEYVEYVAAAIRLLRHGGLLVVNDVLWQGKVADSSDESDEAIIIREALQAVTESESYQQALVPCGDGLLIAVKE